MTNHKPNFIIILVLCSSVASFLHTSSSPATAITTQTVTDPVGEMVYIPAGEFPMGCDPEHNGGLACYDFQLPIHTVYLDDYFIDKYEVTNAQYAACVAAGVCSQPYHFYSKTRESYYDNPIYANYPVIWVRWAYAKGYCQWAGKDLPTEAQWEKAAHGTSIQAYPWGDAIPDCTMTNSNGCVGDTSPVSSLPAGASPYGVMDMAGNVWEWVNDWYADDYYAVSPTTNPTGPASGMYIGIRGGSFGSAVWEMQATLRSNRDPLYRSNFAGFRCAVNKHIMGRITSPADHYTTGPASVPINASVSYPGGPGISQVEFFARMDGQWHPLGIDTTEPYSVIWMPPLSLHTQQVLFRIDALGSDGKREEYVGGIVHLNYVQSQDNPALSENWISNRAYLNQRSLTPPQGDIMCSAASMAMLLAMEGRIPQDYSPMAAKAIEMYPKVLVSNTAYIWKMVNVMKTEGTNAQYFGPMDHTAGWNKLKETIDDNHPLIVRTLRGSMTNSGHFIVAVGYQEEGGKHLVIAYDPYGEWKGKTCNELGSGCPGNYYRNSTDPTSTAGRWTFYDFDKIFGDYLIIAPNASTRASSAPDPVSDEERIEGTYEGSEIENSWDLFLPLVIN